MTDYQGWRDWLAGPGCWLAMTEAARFVYRMATRVGLPSSLLPCGNPWSLPREERDECFEELAREMWLFLRSMSAQEMKRIGADPTTHGNTRLLMQRIGQRFFLHLKDQARTSPRDPERALYRRLRQVLSQEPTVAYRTTADGAFYSRDPGAPWPGTRKSLHEEPYSSWESPLGRIGLRDLPRRSALLDVADFFWLQATTRLGEPSFLPVRELARFIACHYPGFSLPTPVSIHPGGTKADCLEGREVEVPSGEPGPDIQFMAQRLPALARQLVHGWDLRQRSAFVLLVGDGVPLQEAARSLGYRNPSGVSYLARSVYDSLRDFCLLWPGLSPPDLDPGLFEAFVLEVVTVCKKGT